MINATSLRAGEAFIYEGKPYLVLKYNLIKMGRGGALVKVNTRNLLNGATVEHSFSSNLSFEEISLSKQDLQYLYKDEKNALFMNPQTYEQVEIPLTLIGDQISFIKEGSTVSVRFWDEKPLEVELPPKVVLQVEQCDPGVKGNSASNIYKPAILENGSKIKVPLFIKKGDRVRVDTRTQEYIGRAK